MMPHMSGFVNSSQLSLAFRETGHPKNGNRGKIESSVQRVDLEEREAGEDA
jgi:hypothetical protein